MDDEPPPQPPPNDDVIPDTRTMEELCQPTMHGRGGPIAPLTIGSTDFGLKHHMTQQVQNSCQFHGLPGFAGKLGREKVEGDGFDRGWFLQVK